MGGRAFQGTTRIKKKYVKPTLEDFFDEHVVALWNS